MSMTNPTEIGNQSIESWLQILEQHHRGLLAELAGLGLVLPGTIVQRYSRCESPTCRCKAQPPILHGPNWTWTRKEAGKPVSVSFGSEQAARYKEWTRNMRKLDRIVRQLQATGIRAATMLRGS